MTRALLIKRFPVTLCAIALTALAIGAVQVSHTPQAPVDNLIQTAIVVLRIAKTLRMQTREVTVARWQTCHAAGYCGLSIAVSGAP